MRESLPREPQQSTAETETESRGWEWGWRGHLLIISWPAGGALAHFKGTAGARQASKGRIPEKQPPSPPKKMLREKTSPSNRHLPHAEAARAKLQGSSSGHAFPAPFVPSSTVALQRPTRAGGRQGKRWRQTDSQAIFLLVSRPRQASANGTGRT